MMLTQHTWLSTYMKITIWKVGTQRKWFWVQWIKIVRDIFLMKFLNDFFSSGPWLLWWPPGTTVGYQILAEDEILFVGLERKLEGFRLWCSPHLQGPPLPQGIYRTKKPGFFRIKYRTRHWYWANFQIESSQVRVQVPEYRSRFLSTGKLAQYRWLIWYLL